MVVSSAVLPQIGYGLDLPLNIQMPIHSVKPFWPLTKQIAVMPCDATWCHATAAQASLAGGSTLNVRCMPCITSGAAQKMSGRHSLSSIVKNLIGRSTSPSLLFKGGRLQQQKVLRNSCLLWCLVSISRFVLHRFAHVQRLWQWASPCRQT